MQKQKQNGRSIKIIFLFSQAKVETQMKKMVQQSISKNVDERDGSTNKSLF